MTADDRRKSIIHYLKTAKEPTSAAVLASNFRVSRQIIVGDIALIRAQGTEIHSTPRGYTLDPEAVNNCLKTISCKHDGSLMEKELQICIDHGCKVLDVSVEHPIYGQLTGDLRLSSRYDISQFIQRVIENQAHSLCELTNDLHSHTLDCPSEEIFQRVCSELRACGILYENESL